MERNLTPVQIVLTLEQIRLLNGAVGYTLAEYTNDPESELMDAEEASEFERLGTFFHEVELFPYRFRPQGKLATSIRPFIRAAKGTAQPGPRKNKRKQRQEKRRTFHKRRRAERKAMVEAWNAAVAMVEAELAEAEEIAREDNAQARLEAAAARARSAVDTDGGVHDAQHGRPVHQPDLHDGHLGGA